MGRSKLYIGIVVVVFSVGLFTLSAVSISRSSRAARLHDQAAEEMRLGNYNHARTFFEDALALRPDEPTFLANYGLCLEMLDDNIGANDAYRHSLELAEDPEVLFRLGRSTCKGGEIERGVQLMWEAHSLALLTPRQAGDMGVCLAASGRGEQAIPYLEQGLVASPNNPEIKQALEEARLMELLHQ